MTELKKCPWCGAKAIVYPFVSQIAELPKPIKLFGRWSLIKMRYKEIPVNYSAECSEFCDGFAEECDLCVGATQEEAIKNWNDCVERKGMIGR